MSGDGTLLEGSSEVPLAVQGWTYDKDRFEKLQPGYFNHNAKISKYQDVLMGLMRISFKFHLITKIFLLRKTYLKYCLTNSIKVIFGQLPHIEDTGKRKILIHLHKKSFIWGLWFITQHLVVCIM